MNTADVKSKGPRKLGKTSTLEILGVRNGSSIRPKWLEHYRRLSEIREQFIHGRIAQTESAREHLSTSTEHIADAATDSYDRDCALALLSSTQNALYEIDQALNRISEGSYGICELSGEPIERERLKAIPWTRFSARAQAQIEARGGGGRVQLGELGTCLKLTDREAVAEEDTEDAAAPAEHKQAA